MVYFIILAPQLYNDIAKKMKSIQKWIVGLQKPY